MMSCRVSRLLHLAIALLIGLSAVAPLSPVSAQDGGATAISGNSYVSPAFWYEVTWDEQLWQPIDEYSSWNYTSLLLGSVASFASVEGLYAYQGKPEACFEYESQGVAELLGVPQLSPLTDSAGEPLIELSNERAGGLFEMPEDAIANGTESVLALECITLIPDYAVLIITGYLDQTVLDAQASNTLLVGTSLNLGTEVPPTPDPVEYNDYVASVAADIKQFWTDTFSELDYSFAPPSYEIVDFPAELECGGNISVQEGANYCDVSQTITIGDDEFLTEELPIGLGVAEYVLGHEMGHHVYMQLDLGTCDISDCYAQDAITSNELTSDCLSGAWMQDAVATGFFDEQTVARVESGLRFRILGSPGDDFHGTPEQSFTAYNTGYEGGFAACIGA